MRAMRTATVMMMAILPAVLSGVPSGRAQALRPTGAALVAEWGMFAAGPLGTTACCAQRLTPTGVPGAGPAVAAALIGSGGTVVVRPDGTVWAWGQTLLRPAISLLPVQVAGLSQVTTVAAGQSFALALEADGSVWSWGNDEPALGRSTDAETPASVPARITGLPPIVRLSAAGDDALAVGDNGDLYAWGENWTGAIGDGTRAERRVPVKVMGLSQVVSASTSNQNAVAVEADGSVWAWGDDASGVPVHVDLVQSLTPVRVTGSPLATAAVAGNSTGMALARDGTVWAWGENSGDALHTGHPTSGADGSPAAPVMGLTSVTAIASGGNRSMAIEQGGSVWVWGGAPGAPVSQAGLAGAVAIAASPEGWLALVSAAPPAPHVVSPHTCSRVVAGRLTMSGYPAAMQIDAATGHVFVLDRAVLPGSDGLCSASVTTLDGHTGKIVRIVLLGAGSATIGRTPVMGLLTRSLVPDGGTMIAGYTPRLASVDTAAGISAIDVHSGRVMRSISAGYSVDGIAANPASGHVFVSVAGGQGEGPYSLLALDGRRTAFDVPLPIGGMPMVDGGAERVVVLGSTGSVTIDIRTGALVRRGAYAGGAMIDAGLAAFAHRLYVTFGVSPHCCGPSLVVMNTTTGAVVSQVKGGEFGAIVVDAPRGRVLIANGHVTEVREARTGRIVRRLPFAVTGGAVVDRTGRVYAVTAPSTVSVLDPARWTVVRRYRFTGSVLSVALDSRTGRLFALTQQPGRSATQTVRSVCVAAGCRD
jgi:alpha-tubulin suppressor-like RCC1 family protein